MLVCFLCFGIELAPLPVSILASPLRSFLISKLRLLILAFLVCFLRFALSFQYSHSFDIMLSFSYSFSFSLNQHPPKFRILLLFHLLSFVFCIFRRLFINFILEFCDLILLIFYEVFLSLD